MERYMTNRRNGRSMQNAPGTCPSCQMRRPSEAGHTSCQKKTSMYAHVDQMIPAMAYVPYQSWQEPFDLHYALHAGTIFPALCKPFCGRRNMHR